MGIKKIIEPPVILCLAILLVFLSRESSFAVPSFARQDGAFLHGLSYRIS